MFPAEILALICEYLPLEDVVALCQTNQQLRNGVPESVVQKLVIEKCPYFNLKYSQSDNWVDAASHLLNDKPPKFLDSQHKNQPLPDDFYTLCKDVEKTFPWDYNDKGISFQGKLLDLTEAGSTKTAPSRDHEGLLQSKQVVSYNEISMDVPGKLIQTRHSSKAVAILFEIQRTTILGVKYKNGEVKASPIKAEAPYRLQVIGDCAVLHAHDCSSGFCVQYFTPDSEVENIECPFVKGAPAGIALYNGNFFNITLEARYAIRVERSASSRECKHTNRLFRVYQDEKHPEYCLMYKPSGIVTGLVDFRNRQASIISEHGYGFILSNFGANDHEDYLLMVGVSKGALGIWKYTRRYLADKYKAQHGLNLPEPLMKALADKRDALDSEHLISTFRGMDVDRLQEIALGIKGLRVAEEDGTSELAREA